MTIARLLTVSVFFVLGFAGSAVAGGMPHAQKWDFDVTLDGTPIGNHVFTLEKAGKNKGAWRVSSEANFTVTFLGIAAYHYHHVANETWKGGCLAELTADTNDDGNLSHVEAIADGQGGHIRSVRTKNDNEPVTLDWGGCLMNFAYWNPAMRMQSHLLNPQTGEIDNIQVTQLPDEKIMVHGTEVDAQVWHVAGRHEPLDVLYAPNGEWIGLNATVEGDRKLAYRLP